MFDSPGVTEGVRFVEISLVLLEDRCDEAAPELVVLG